MSLASLSSFDPANTHKTHSDAHILHLLQQGDDRALNDLYTTHRVPFFKWAEKHFGLDYHQAVDVYQDAIVALHENVRSGKLQGLQCSLKTYLFSIGKHLILSLFRQQKREQAALEGWEQEEKVAAVRPLSPNPAEGQQEMLDALSESLHSLPEKSRALIGLFYFDKMPMKEISLSLGYKNENVAKSTKLRCLGILREALLQKVTQQYA